MWMGVCKIMNLFTRAMKMYKKLVTSEHLIILLRKF